jgi:transcriptional regulator with XRE-family HTH domain
MTPKQFKTFREKLGLTQQDMAEALRLKTARAISQYENGDRSISGPISLCLDYIKKYGLWKEKNNSEKRK